ncbi:MAG: radical SAM protein [Clostridiales bacterium]|nr:radical SAM protein [Clostridiales bacterium]
MKHNYIIPIFVPHKGCPNQCIFCNQKKISGQIKDLTTDDVRKIIDEYLEINNNIDYSNIEVAFYGGSFTGIEYEKQIELLKVANEYIKNKKINSIRLSTRPDYINQEILDYLKKYGVRLIELGVQSMNNEVLNRALRGHTSQDVINASKLIKKNGILLGLQMMVGLPESNEEKEIQTAKEFIKLKPYCVRIYPVLVIKDTPLEEEYYNGIYQACDLEKAIKISAKLFQMFEKENIIVIRMGLQTTDNINEGRDVVAGPFHPAFGELVSQYIRFLEIEEYIKNNDLRSKDLIIKCNNKEISKIIGNKKENILKIKSRYDINVKVQIDNNIGENQYIIENKE